MTPLLGAYKTPLPLEMLAAPGGRVDAEHGVGFGDLLGVAGSDAGCLDQGEEAHSAEVDGAQLVGRELQVRLPGGGTAGGAVGTALQLETAPVPGAARILQFQNQPA